MIIGCVSLIEIDNKIVAVDCAKGRGFILPGGKWETNETYEQTANRELFEETGLQANKQTFLFGGMCPDLTYCYTFCTDIEEYNPRETSSGVPTLVGWKELFDSFYGPYYRLVKSQLYYPPEHPLSRP